MKSVYLIGSGHQAREAAAYAEAAGLQLAGYVLENSYITNPVLQKSFEEVPGKSNFACCAIGAPGLRRRLSEKWQGGWINIIHPSAIIQEGSPIGLGSIVAPGVIVSTDASIGRHAILNLGVTVSHDCTIGEYVTVSPGVNIAGSVRVGDGAFLGIGAVVTQGVSIGEGAVIGAGAVVIDDVPPGAVVVGSPARIIKHLSEWLYEL